MPTVITLIIWLVLGIFVSGVVQRAKDFHWFPYITRRYPWGVRVFTLLFCIFLSWIVSHWLTWNWLMPCALYAFSHVAFTHIYRPLSKKTAHDLPPH